MQSSSSSHHQEVLVYKYVKSNNVLLNDENESVLLCFWLLLQRGVCGRMAEEGLPKLILGTTDTAKVSERDAYFRMLTSERRCLRG